MAKSVLEVNIDNVKVKFHLGDPVVVHGGDYKYEGTLVAIFNKTTSNVVRVVVEDDNGRLFIHRPAQLDVMPNLV